MSIATLFRADQLELPSGTNNGYSFVVNELTGEVEETLQTEFLRTIADPDGLLNDKGLEYFGIDSRTDNDYDGDYVPEDTFLGGRQSVIPEGLTFRGGNQLMTDSTLGGAQVLSESIEKHEIKFLQEVLSEIFDGRHDLADIDKEFLLDPDSGMPQTLRSIFINKPGHNGGKSSIRHIFKGDKSGGLHVPAFAPELAVTEEEPTELFTPFDAVVSINGISKLIVNNSDGAHRLEPARTSMFPRGLDSLAVLQCVIDAWEHKGNWSVSISRDNGLSNIYEVPVTVDGARNPMMVRLVTDSNTLEEKIRTAFPVIAKT